MIPLAPPVRPIGLIMRTYDDWKTSPPDDGRTPSTPQTDPEHWRLCPRCGAQTYHAGARPFEACARCLHTASKVAAEGARHRIDQDAERALRLVLAGDARVTLRNAASGNRFTYRVERAPAREGKPGNAFFVSVLDGPENTRDYAFIGTVFDGRRFAPGKPGKSRVSADAPSARVFAAVFAVLASGRLPRGVEVWHEGRCCVCGRPLTTPESIAAGIGPWCAEQQGF